MTEQTTVQQRQPLTETMTTVQSKALARFARLKVGAAFLEQGMGKTRLALELANSRAHKLDAVLWVAPYSVLPTVRAEVDKWGCSLPVRCVGYQTLSQSDRTYLDVLDWAKKRRLMIVADESTFIKNAKALRHQRLTEIRKTTHYALVLTGTPLTRDLWDLKRQMDWLSPKILDTSDRAFRYRYFRMKQRVSTNGSERVWFEAYEPNIAHLKTLMTPYIFEARLDVGVPETTREIEHSVSSETHHAYQRERDDFFDIWEHQLGEEIALYRMLGNLKKLAAIDPAKCASIAARVEGTPTLVFCQYREEQRRIADHLEQRLVVNGDTSTADREKAYRRSHNEDIPLLLTYGTGSYGLNLQHRASCHFASQPFDYGDIQQARSRIRRLGQQQPLTYTTHTSDLGIDALIGQNLGRKGWLAELLRRELDPTATL
ncbi:DEAD/DEAH box helicase [Streptomyces sp. SM12]|uniref:SNF2-related protein n=1 Tax=Streptomyces sp. SM12 TaxID=1071602 RepID=UPI000CD5A343|nr:DEAD/DEAH box helicase [Streptomyces sp. SM12]